MTTPKNKSRHPAARRDLIVSELPGEALIYDFTTHRAHCMNDLCYRVFQRCDGYTPVSAIASRISADLAQIISVDLVLRAIAELTTAGLLVKDVRPQVNYARRRVLKQVAMTAGLSVALPMVWSIVAPTVAQAASKVSCVPASACMGASAGTCCGTTGSLAMSCTSTGCDGNAVSCVLSTCS